MSLPSSNSEAPLTPLVNKVVFFVNRQALPVGPSASQPSPAKAHALTGRVLKLGVGIGTVTVFNAFYGASSLAASFPEDLIKNDIQPTSADIELALAHQVNSPSASQPIPPWEMTRTDQSAHTLSLINSPDRRTALSQRPEHALSDMGELAPRLTQPQPFTGNHQARLLGVQGNYSPKFSVQTASNRTKKASQPKAHATLVPDGITADPSQKSEASAASLEVDALEVDALEQEAFTVEDTSLKDASLSQAPRPEETPLAESDASVLQNAPLQNTSLENGAVEDGAVEDGAVENGLVEDGAASRSTALKNTTENTLAQAQSETTIDTLAQRLDPLSQRLEQLQRAAQVEESGEPDDELGTLRIQQTRGRANEELGVLRLLQTAQAPPPKPKPPISFLTGRLGFFSSENAFRSTPRLTENINQAGLAYYLFPKLSDSTSLYVIAETNLARYGNFGTVDYNELEYQLGVRQRLFPRTFAQVGWRNQRLYSPGYREKLFSVHYIDTLISHRSILNSKTWVDGFYQARLGFADPDSASRFRQTFTVSLNYGVSRDFRTSLLYQLDLDDYTQVARHDTYQQILGVISYNLTPESRVSLFGGSRFGRSSNPGVNLDDTFYGAGLNVSVPLF